LTEREFSKKLVLMDGDVTTLETKLDQFLAHFQQLREENLALRERVAGLEGEKLNLTDKMQSARVRLEALMERLPEQ
jgi:cell division protein ZapB